MGIITLNLWHGGLFKRDSFGMLYYEGRDYKTFAVDSDEMSWWELLDLAKKCGGHNEINNIQYCIPTPDVTKGGEAQSGEPTPKRPRGRPRAANQAPQVVRSHNAIVGEASAQPGILGRGNRAIRGGRGSRGRGNGSTTSARGSGNPTSAGAREGEGSRGRGRGRGRSQQPPTGYGVYICPDGTTMTNYPRSGPRVIGASTLSQDPQSQLSNV